MRKGEIETERDDTIRHTPRCGRTGSSESHENRVNHLRKGVRILRFYDAL